MIALAGSPPCRSFADMDGTFADKTGTFADTGGRYSDFGDHALESIFSDEAIAREREERMTIRLRADALRDFDHDAVGLPAAGYDHANENDRWNRRSARSARGDRRSNRGGPGRS